jgi:hypothetical protein
MHNDRNIVTCSSHGWLNRTIIFVCLHISFLTLLHWLHWNLVLEIHSSQFHAGPQYSTLTYTSYKADIKLHKS